MTSYSDIRQPQGARTASTEQRDADVMGRCQRMLHRWRTRRALLTLTPAELRDVGLSESQAQAEASKPFWKG